MMARWQSAGKKKTKRRPRPRSVFSLPRTGYIRTSDALRKPKRSTPLPQRKGETDKDYAARLDAARQDAYERALRAIRGSAATRAKAATGTGHQQKIRVV
jgi:hypothetical protein